MAKHGLFMGQASHFIGHFGSGMVFSWDFWVGNCLLMGGAKVFANVETIYLFSFAAAYTEAATEEKALHNCRPT